MVRHLGEGWNASAGLKHIGDQTRPRAQRQQAALGRRGWRGAVTFSTVAWRKMPHPLRRGCAILLNVLRNSTVPAKSEGIATLNLIQIDREQGLVPRGRFKLVAAILSSGTQIPAG